MHKIHYQNLWILALAPKIKIGIQKLHKWAHNTWHQVKCINTTWKYQNNGDAVWWAAMYWKRWYQLLRIIWVEAIISNYYNKTIDYFNYFYIFNHKTAYWIFWLYTRTSVLQEEGTLLTGALISMSMLVSCSTHRALTEVLMIVFSSRGTFTTLTVL